MIKINNLRASQLQIVKINKSEVRDKELFIWDKVNKKQIPSGKTERKNLFILCVAGLCFSKLQNMFYWCDLEQADKIKEKTILNNCIFYISKKIIAIDGKKESSYSFNLLSFEYITIPQNKEKEKDNEIKIIDETNLDDTIAVNIDFGGINE